MFEPLVITLGFGIHADKSARPEIQGLDNPIGIVRMSNKWDNGLETYCEHISSIPTWEKGYGFNHCGVLMRIK